MLLVSLFVAFSMSAITLRPLRHHEVPVPVLPQPPPLLMINSTRSLNIHFKKLGWIRSLEYCRRNNQILATIPSKEVNKELVKSYGTYYGN